MRTAVWKISEKNMTGNGQTDCGKAQSAKEKKDAIRRRTLAWRRSLGAGDAGKLSAGLCSRLTAFLEERCGRKAARYELETEKFQALLR